MLQRSSRIIFLAIITTLFLVPQMVSGLTVSKITVDPDGPVIQGTPVNISFSISFPVSSGETFPSGGELQMSTDLEKPQWTWTLITDGVRHPQPPAGGRLLALSGFELAYPSSVQESLTITLTGMAPEVERTRNKTLIKIRTIDDTNCNCVSDSSFRFERIVLVINSSEIPGIIINRNISLKQFRKSLDEKTAMGIDTAAAEVKYLDAAQKIDRAGQLPPHRFMDAMNNLTAANADIAEGERLLDKAWAEKEVVKAEEKLSETDAMIGWFRGNRSTASHPELQPIEMKRELAFRNLSAANEQIASGNYTQARMSVKYAVITADDANGDAFLLQSRVTSCPFCGLAPFYYEWFTPLNVSAGIVVLGVLFAGFYWGKKRKNGETP